MKLLRILLLIPPLVCARALVVQDYAPAANDRFASGFPTAPVPNESAQFMGKGLDFSGVGWWKKDPQYGVTLIGSRNFTYACHMSPAPGDALMFFGGDGKLHEYHVANRRELDVGQAGGRTLHPDTGIGTLAETVPLADRVTHYPVVVLPHGIEPLIGKKIIMYGHMARIGSNEVVEGIMMRSIGSEYNFLTHGLRPGMGKCESGDSGSPAFLIARGRLALLGTHWQVDTDCLVAGFVEEMRAALAADGGKLETVPLE